MRRLVSLWTVTLIIGLCFVAWVNAQDSFRRKSTAPRTLDQASEYAPRRLASPENAAPIEMSISDTNVDSAVQPVAGGEPTLADPPKESPLQNARRAIRGAASRLGPTVMPSSPPTTDGEIPPGDETSNGPSVPSVLKKKAGAVATQPSLAPPVKAPAETHVEPAIVTSTIENESPKSTSSRRITAGGSRPTTIRSETTTTAPRQPAASQPQVTAQATPSKSGPMQFLELNGQSPKLSVAAMGPQAVTVGKLATYTVRLTNDGNQSAQDIEVRVGLPQWVEVHGGQGTRGDAKQDTDATGRQWLVWNLSDIAATSKEQLTLDLIVRENQPFELAVYWTTRPVGVAAEVAVREPQVEVRLEGPSDMLFGEQKPFTLHVSNPGTGDAENVIVDVSSSGTAANRLQVGTLAAGEKKQVSFTVAAAAPGEMEIRAVAAGDGGLTAEAASRVLVHKAELQVAIDAPPLKFAGGETTFQVAVANVGDALAEGVTLSVALPHGAKYIGGVDGAAAAGDGLTFKVGSLAANTEKVFDIRCVLTQAGENRVDVHAQGKGDLAAAGAGITKVEALADLKLQVSEPNSPVVVGTDATYEVKIANRGTKAAEQVKVIVAFAQGLEPSEAFGGSAEMLNGQAIFKPVNVPAGGEVVLKVKAKSETSGNHAFRVEVKGSEDTKLVSEGITRCFPESSTPRATARKPGLSPVAPTKTR